MGHQAHDQVEKVTSPNMVEAPIVIMSIIFFHYLLSNKQTVCDLAKYA